MSDEKTPFTSSTPELDKELQAREEGGSQQIGEFVDWLRSKGFAICRWDEESRMSTLGEEHPGLVLIGADSEMKVEVKTTGWVPCRQSPRALLELYFDIDTNKAEEERMALLEAERAKVA